MVPQPLHNRAGPWHVGRLCLAFMSLTGMTLAFLPSPLVPLPSLRTFSRELRSPVSVLRASAEAEKKEEKGPASKSQRQALIRAQAAARYNALKEQQNSKSVATRNSATKNLDMANKALALRKARQMRAMKGDKGSTIKGGGGGAGMGGWGGGNKQYAVVTDDDKVCEEARMKAQAAVDGGSYFQAISILERSRKSMKMDSPQGCRAALELAMAYEMAGDYENAKRNYGVIIRKAGNKNIQTAASNLFSRLSQWQATGGGSLPNSPENLYGQVKFDESLFKLSKEDFASGDFVRKALAAPSQMDKLRKYSSYESLQLRYGVRPVDDVDLARERLEQAAQMSNPRAFGEAATPLNVARRERPQVAPESPVVEAMRFFRTALSVRLQEEKGSEGGTVAAASPGETGQQTQREAQGEGQEEDGDPESRVSSLLSSLMEAGGRVGEEEGVEGGVGDGGIGEGLGEGSSAVDFDGAKGFRDAEEAALKEQSQEEEAKEEENEAAGGSGLSAPPGTTVFGPGGWEKEWRKAGLEESLSAIKGEWWQVLRIDDEGEVLYANSEEGQKSRLLPFLPAAFSKKRSQAEAQSNQRVGSGRFAAAPVTESALKVPQLVIVTRPESFNGGPGRQLPQSASARARDALRTSSSAEVLVRWSESLGGFGETSADGRAILNMRKGSIDIVWDRTQFALGPRKGGSLSTGGTPLPIPSRFAILHADRKMLVLWDPQAERSSFLPGGRKKRRDPLAGCSLWLRPSIEAQDEKALLRRGDRQMLQSTSTKRVGGQVTSDPYSKDYFAPEPVPKMGGSSREWMAAAALIRAEEGEAGDIQEGQAGAVRGMEEEEDAGTRFPFPSLTDNPLPPVSAVSTATAQEGLAEPLSLLEALEAEPSPEATVEKKKTPEGPRYTGAGGDMSLRRDWGLAEENRLQKRIGGVLGNRSGDIKLIRTRQQLFWKHMPMDLRKSPTGPLP
uniref:Uncharacterized protein n=1 Tax=Chromera velia CCMP2878 TaxID=1169474 RepID=A0A0G4F5Q3_9ALVE|eukprot:Cvel_15296.t1-p1 / transcript=Cvel_15296.t1 / gene=Cvel_15296 / organism=Chromera_velia_CCMP2878 / gene_product=hypothetical protein / transcript_product=hypothetical protein / location=Cvel_scaffold1123:1213-7372(+) / protein_length=959 / sequence_SO=supercontig / SO=protein_coding / is_pseudo=false